MKILKIFRVITGEIPALESCACASCKEWAKPTQSKAIHHKLFHFLFKRQGFWILMWVLLIDISSFLLKVEYKNRILFPLLPFIECSLCARHCICSVSFSFYWNSVWCNSDYFCFADAETDLPKATKLVTTQPGSGPGRCDSRTHILHCLLCAVSTGKGLWHSCKGSIPR